MHSHEEFVALLNGHIEKMIDAVLVDNEGQFRENQALYEATVQGRDVKLCMHCGPCHDFDFNFGVLSRLTDESMSLEEAERQLQAWKYATYADMARTSISNPSGPIEFARSTFSTDLPMIYLDQNVISNAAKQEGLLNDMLRLKEERKVQYVYSPAHLEEVHKIPDKEFGDRHLEVFTLLTDNATLHPGAGDQIELSAEEPIYALRRVEATLPATEAVENIKILKNTDRKLHFARYETKEHRDEIANNKRVFESLPDDEFRHLMALAASSGDKNDFKGRSTHSGILRAIYSLHNSLDLLSYKRERKEQQVRSSAHDVEHLIYASRCRFFVTEDGRLADRAKQIYAFMEFDVEVLTTEQFLAKLASS